MKRCLQKKACTVKQSSAIVVLKVFYHSQISPFFSLCMLMFINEFKVLTRFSEISFFAFNFWYIFRLTFTSNKVFYFFRVNVFIVCNLSKIDLQLQKKVWFYFAQSVRFFISKTFDFLFRKKRCSSKITVPELSILLNDTLRDKQK